MPVVPRFFAGVAVAFAPISWQLVFARLQVHRGLNNGVRRQLRGPRVGGAVETSRGDRLTLALIMVAVLYDSPFMAGRRHLVPAG